MARTAGRLGATWIAVAIGLALLGCGGSSRTASSQTTKTAAWTAAANPVIPQISLRIIAPRRDAHTGRSVSVRVRVSGATATRHLLRYVLDGRIARLGPAHVTFDELAPGRHRLLVALAADPSVRASRFFVVRAPAPVAAPAPPPATTATTQTPEPAREPSPAPPQATTQPAPSPAPSSGSIPQGNGGDQDSDNNGAPSDGDGNV